MSTEQNKAVVRRFYEEFNNWDSASSMLAPDYIAYMNGAPEPLSMDQHAAMAQGAIAAFPDLNITIHEQIAEGDKVFTRQTAAGTHKGDFQGMPATGKTFSMESWGLDRVVDGKIVEHRAMDDVMTMMQQLGMMPAPVQAE